MLHYNFSVKFLKKSRTLIVILCLGLTQRPSCLKILKTCQVKPKDGKMQHWQCWLQTLWTQTRRFGKRKIDWLLISDYKQLKTVNTWHPPPHLKWINIAIGESSFCHPDYCFHSFNRKTTETQPLLRPISPRQRRPWKMISPRTNSSLSCCMSLGDRNSHPSRYELVLLLKLS